MATSPIDDLFNYITYFSWISALVLICLMLAFRSMRTNRTREDIKARRHSFIDQVFCLEFPGDGLFAMDEIGPTCSSLLSSFIVLFIIVPLVFFWDCILLGMLLAHIEKWPTEDGIWYVFNAIGYRIVTQTPVTIKDDAGRIVAVAIFCHLYALVNTILGFSSLLRVARRLALGRMPQRVWHFVGVCWLLVPMLLLLFGGSFSFVLSGISDFGIFSSFLFVMDYSLTGGDANLAPDEGHISGSGFFLALVVAVWTFAASGMFLGTFGAHLGVGSFMSFLEGMDPELHALRRFEEASNGSTRICRKRPYALSAGDLGDLMPGHPPRACGTFEDVSHWLRQMENAAEVKEEEDVEQECEEFVGGDTVIAPAAPTLLAVTGVVEERDLSASRAREASPQSPQKPSDIADVELESGIVDVDDVGVTLALDAPATAGKAFGQGGIQDILRSLKSGMVEGSSEDDTFPPGVAWSAAHAHPGGVSQAPSMDIDELGGCMLAESRADEAEQKLALSEERVRDAEMVAQEAIQRIRQADESAAEAQRRAHEAEQKFMTVGQELPTLMKSGSQMKEGRMPTQAAELLPCTTRMPVLGDQVTVATTRTSKDNKWTLNPMEVATVMYVDSDGDFCLRNPAGEDSSFVLRKHYLYFEEAAEPSVSTAVHSDLSPLHERIEALELKLAETEKALIASRAKATAAESRLERATIKEKLLTAELNVFRKTKDLVDRPTLVKDEVDAEDADVWGLGDAEDRDTSAGEALERLKTKQREEQRLAQPVADPKWRAHEFRKGAKEEEPWQLCTGVRDCGSRGRR